MTQDLSHRDMLLDVDPWCQYVLDEACKLLQVHNKISVYDLYESMGGYNKTPIKEVTLRKKFNKLVALNLLECVPGRGRTPSYYFLPGNNAQHNYREILKQYLKHIHDCESTFYLSDAGYEPGRPANLNAVEWEVLNSIVEEIESEREQN